MPTSHYFVAIFSESQSTVFEAVKKTWKCFNTDESNQKPPTPGSFEMSVPLGNVETEMCEHTVGLSGSIHEHSGKTRLVLHNMTSDKWISVPENSKALVEFCAKYKPEIAYVYYSGGAASPIFVFYTKEKGLLVDLRKIDLFDDKNVKLLEDCFGKSMTGKRWEQLHNEGRLFPMKECKVP